MNYFEYKVILGTSHDRFSNDLILKASSLNVFQVDKARVKSAKTLSDCNRGPINFMVIRSITKDDGRNVKDVNLNYRRYRIQV